MKVDLFFFVFMTLLLASSKLNANKVDVPHVENWIYDEVMSSVPSNPDESGGSGLLGVDYDSDGIRDDVELFIIDKYPADENVYLRNSLFNIARFYQKVLSISGDKPDLTFIFTSEYLVPRQCILNDFDAIVDARDAVIDVQVKTFNTMERIKKYFSLTEVINENFVSGRHYIEYYKKRGNIIPPSCASYPKCSSGWDYETKF